MKRAKVKNVKFNIQKAAKRSPAKKAASSSAKGKSKNSVRTESKKSKGKGGDSAKKTSSSATVQKSSGGHFSKRAPEPVGPYPHARKVGDFIFVSGMGPRTPGGAHIPGVHMDAMGHVQSHDIVAQTHSVIQNIKNVLEDMGSGLEDIVDVTVFLTHMKDDFKTFNKIYGEYFAKIGPTRTTVEVKSLPTPINVELKVIAYCR
jgi:2-aminomuconate deaminase